VVALPSGSALVSCPSDDRLVEVNASGVIGTTPLPGRPTSLAVSGDELYVTASLRGVVRRGMIAEVLAGGGDELVVEDEPGFAASQLDVLGASPEGDVVAAYQRVDHDSDRDRPADRGGYGSVVDGEPRIEPRILAPCGGRYARFDGGAEVFSGPSAIAMARDRLWVVNQYTDDVALIRCSSSSGLSGPSSRRAEVLATFRLGRGPRGITLSEDGSTAWVDVGFDHAVARLDAEGRGVVDPIARRRSLGDTRLSAIALRGRNLFHDADDIHLTPSGIVTCATCHPGGGEDGLSWFLHTPGVARKLRRTPPAWGARASFLPFHWDGEFDDAAVLSGTTIRELMEGDGLLIELDAIAAYMAEVAPPMQRLPNDAAQADRGEQVFQDAGCADCHAGGGSDGLAHRVLEASSDPDARLESVGTPPLLGVRARAPYLHDGRAATLRDVVTIHNERDQHGRTSALDETALRDLMAYLETL
ncbi:MAG: c-type cytochrome, partial [Myxococcota bacterium]